VTKEHSCVNGMFSGCRICFQVVGASVVCEVDGKESGAKQKCLTSLKGKYSHFYIMDRAATNWYFRGGGQSDV